MPREDSGGEDFTLARKGAALANRQAQLLDLKCDF
jgi:hypothetical protein